MTQVIQIWVERAGAGAHASQVRWEGPVFMLWTRLPMKQLAGDRRSRASRSLMILNRGSPE